MKQIIWEETRETPDEISQNNETTDITKVLEEDSTEAPADLEVLVNPTETPEIQVNTEAQRLPTSGAQTGSSETEKLNQR